jgi:hypothetical protein
MLFLQLENVLANNTWPYPKYQMHTGSAASNTACLRPDIPRIEMKIWGYCMPPNIRLKKTKARDSEFL